MHLSLTVNGSEKTFYVGDEGDLLRSLSLRVHDSAVVLAGDSRLILGDARELWQLRRGDDTLLTYDQIRRSRESSNRSAQRIVVGMMVFGAILTGLSMRYRRG